jgi:hypothetical protein
VDGGETRLNLDPVWPDVVRFEWVEWVPVADGGHRFLFQAGDGSTAGFIEAFERRELQRLVVVHGERRLEFSSPKGHVQKLRTIVTSDSKDEFYLPTAEVVVGSALRACSVRVKDFNRSHENFSAAERVWVASLDALDQISELALEGIRKHNQSELSEL